MGIRIGIGSLKIGQGSTGVDWSSYCTTPNIVLEGHSFMYEGRYLVDELMAYVTPVAYFNDNAVTLSSYVSSIITKAPIVDSKLMTETKDIKNVLIVWTGTNDFSQGYTAVDTYALLKSYVEARVAAGWKVFVYTCTGRTDFDPTEEGYRVDFNNLMTTDLDLLDDVYVLDTSALSVLDDPSDTVYFSDGVHLTWEGCYHAATLFGAKIAEVYANIVAPTMPSVGTTEVTYGEGASVIKPSLGFGEVTTLTVDGNAKFYRDAAGTLGERSQITLTPGTTYKDIYLKCTDGNYTLKMSNASLTHLYNISAYANVALTANIAQFTGLKYISVNTTTCNISGALTALTSLETIVLLTGTVSVSGVVTGLVNLVTFQLSTTGAVSGSFESAVNLLALQVDGASVTVAGNINPLTKITRLYTVSSGVNLSGDLSNFPDLTYCNIRYQPITYSSKTWANNQVYFSVRQPDAAYSQSVIGQILIDASAVATWTSSKLIAMANDMTSMADTNQGGIWGDYSGVPAPTALATAYKTLIRTKGVTVTLNSITVPGVSGDGAGFPAGFGDWHRS